MAKIKKSGIIIIIRRWRSKKMHCNRLMEIERKERLVP
jgi:hypothetical protein